jgi:hypothetical protein
MAEQWRHAHADAGVQLDPEGSLEGQSLDASRTGGSIGGAAGVSISSPGGGGGGVSSSNISCPVDGNCPSRNGEPSVPETAFFSNGVGDVNLPGEEFYAARVDNFPGESPLATSTTGNDGIAAGRSRFRFCGTAVASVAWRCHLHRSATCRLVREGKWYWHAIPVKRLDAAAQAFNTLNDNDEFREVLGTQSFVTPIADVLNLPVGVFDLLIRALWWLDTYRFRFTQYNKASDLVRRHVVYDSNSCVTVVNKHLLRKVAPKHVGYYTRPRFVMDILRELFPNISARSNVKSTTPVWAINRFQEMSSLARRMKLETSRTAVEARLRLAAEHPAAPISTNPPPIEVGRT